jgi:hypothetical protein
MFQTHTIQSHMISVNSLLVFSVSMAIWCHPLCVQFPKIALEQLVNWPHQETVKLTTLHDWLPDQHSSQEGFCLCHPLNACKKYHINRVGCQSNVPSHWLKTAWILSHLLPPTVIARITVRCYFLHPAMHIITLFSPFLLIVLLVGISEHKGVWSMLPICDNKQLLFFLSLITNLWNTIILLSKSFGICWLSNVYLPIVSFS